MSQFNVFDERQNWDFLAGHSPQLRWVDENSLKNLRQEGLKAVIHFHGVVEPNSLAEPGEGVRVRSSENCVNTKFTNCVYINDSTEPKEMDWYVLPPESLLL